MSKIEKGTRRITLADAVALAAALDVPLDALLVPQGPDEVALTERLRVRMPIALAWLRGMSPLRVESVENYRAPADFIMRGRGIAEVFPLLVEAGPNEDEREALHACAAERRSRAAWLQNIASRLDRTDPLRVELREKVQVERDEADEIEALLLKETKE